MENLIKKIAEPVKKMMELRYAARAQCDYDLEFRITLPTPANNRELYQRWSVPQDWCMENIPDTGGLWSRRRDQQTGELVFTFDDRTNAELFELRFAQ